jgi:predicted amidohydrolase YtcJ
MHALIGRVLTMDPAQPEAGGVGFDDDGRIEVVGPATEVRAAMRGDAEVVELGDELVLPAFIDAHHHYCMAAFDRRTPDLHDLPSIAEILERVERAAAAAPGEGWLRLQGYDPNKLAEHRAPTKDELDEVCRDRPTPA